MDDTDDSAAAEAAAMAEAMGFSTFGSQNPHKKRRYNPSADFSSSSTKNIDAVAATGGNAAPLGTSRPSAASAPANTNEIDLNDEDNDEDGTEGNPSQISSVPGLPARPAASVGSVGYVQRPRNHQQRDDPDRPPWYEGYYDRSSNENPWERLEKEHGLQPRGSWVARQVQQQPAS